MSLTEKDNKVSLLKESSENQYFHELSIRSLMDLHSASRSLVAMSVASFVENEVSQAVTSKDAARNEELLNEEAIKAIKRRTINDGIGLLLVSALTVFVSIRHIDYLHFAIIFMCIDLIGYYPALAFRIININKSTPKLMYWLYNLMHSNTGGLTVALIYMSLGGNPINLLAIPLHFGIDRGVLGNYMKGYGDII